MSASRLSGKSCGSSVIFRSKPSSLSLVMPAMRWHKLVTRLQVIHRPGTKAELYTQHDGAAQHHLQLLGWRCTN